MKQGIKRFYKDVTLAGYEGGTQLMLDDKPLHSEDQHLFGHHSQTLMAGVKSEWEAQGETIDMLSMPLTRLLGGLLDMGDEERALMREELLTYALNDTLCYHQDDASSLAEAQCRIWGGWLDWAAKGFSAEWLITHNIMPVQQSDTLKSILIEWIADLDDASLLMLFVTCQSLSSFILAAALFQEACNATEAVNAAWLEHDMQMEQWGNDEEIIAKKTAAFNETNAAAQFIMLVRS